MSACSFHQIHRISPVQTLYDDQGNVLQTWYGKTIADFGTGGLILTKTGILSDSGKIVVTWLDLNGNDLKDQTIDVQFQEE